MNLFLFGEIFLFLLQTIKVLGVASLGFFGSKTP